MKQPPKTPDENEKKQTGQLPANPLEGTRPVQEAIDNRHPDPGVEELLERYWNSSRDGKKFPGAPYVTVRNAVTILCEDPRWKGRLRFNLFTDDVEIDGRRATDDDLEDLVAWMSETYGLREYEQKKMARALRRAARQAGSYHPLKEYLDSLTWDGTPRVDGWMQRYLGVEDSPLNRALGRCWLISCAARALRPGCKVDTVLVLVGNQGAMKSTAFRTLTGAVWFQDSALDLHNKDGMMALNGIWIYELGELDSLHRSESSTIKAFLSRQQDYYRPPFGISFVRRDRQTVIVGSTNEAEFLVDVTGSRRFWPVTAGACSPIDIAAIEADRDQLWAEALHLFREGCNGGSIRTKRRPSRRRTSSSGRSTPGRSRSRAGSASGPPVASPSGRSSGAP